MRPQMESNNKHLLYSGLVGSAKAFAVEEHFRQNGGQHLVICASKEDAAYFYNDLEALFGEREMDYSKKQILFYPTSYKRPYEPEKPDNSYILSRTEVLQRVSTSERKTLIVSYPEALSEKVFTRKLLAKNTFKLKVGEKVNLDFLTDLLYDYEFENVDFVVEPGQFAIRGGLVDVFSFANDYPYRIEFFGDEVESIRSFNIADQLSIEKLKQIVLLPNMQERAFIEEREAFLQYLPDTTTVWLTDMAFFASQVDKEYDRAIEGFEKLQATEEEEVKALKPGQLFSKSEELLDCLKKRRTVEFGTSSQLSTLNSQLSTINFHTKPQPIFSKNFNLLIDDIAEHKEEGYRVIIFSESSKQLSRIQAILNDINHNDELHRDFETETIAIHGGFIDEDLKVCCYTDHQIFERYHRFHLRDNFSTKQAITLKDLYELKPGDYVTHIDHGIGVYEGLQKMQMGDSTQEVIKISYKDGDTIYLSIHALHKISKYVGKDGTPPTIHRLSSGTWEKLKERTKKRVKELAIDLIKLYSERKAKKGFAYSPDSYLQSTLESSFIYEDTPDQIKTLAEVKADMESDHPMDRLICGDVGFGKTEIAIRAAFKAVCDSKQVAVLVPTTVLSMQHYYTFSERLANMPCNIAYINRFRTTKEIKETLKRVKEGKVDILIGTHRLLSKDVVFKDLGLLIIDEEQKFGVAAKEKIREMRTTIDTLTMSATPIPRTLQFSLIGARDISVITTPPPNRQPIDTQVHVFDEDILRDAIQYELDRGGQVFVVHNKIQTIKELSGLIQRLVPKARIAIGHGQMEGDQLEKIMTQFINGDYDVLVSTTIVESGLDIVNANTMIINDAQNFALNVLHQLRGRVGRNNQKAYCYLFIKPWDTLNDQARKRLQAIEQFSDIGSGIHIALRDLDIRGAGDILGADQSGFINEMGYDMYQKILNEAIQEMKDAGDEGLGDLQMADNSALLRRECSLETDIEALFPSTYISNVTERMNLYKELESIRDPQKLEEFRKKVTDIFGPMPRETEELMQTIPLRMLAADLHFEKIILKKRTFHGYFTGNSQSRYFQSDEFGKFLLFMQANHPVVQLKEANHKLVCSIHNIPTFKAAYHWLGKMRDAVEKEA